MDLIISPEIKTRLIFLADKYETRDFIKNDPSFFMHQYTDPKEQEIAGFIAAVLSFGRRDQIISKTSFILNKAGYSPVKWIFSKNFEKIFPETPEKFYRIFSYSDIRLLFEQLNKILLEYGSLGNAVKTKYLSLLEKKELKNILKTKRNWSGVFCQQEIILSVFRSLFPHCRPIPQTGNSSCKRLNMFLRWMVRQKSSVDLGLWTWYSSRDLLIPLDTHVLQEAKVLSLIPESSTGNLKTAIQLTNTIKQIWPQDPCRADFALFGAGIQKLSSIEKHQSVTKN